MEEFLETYRTFEQDQLFHVLLFSDEYEPEAVQAAKLIIREKGWQTELTKAIEEQSIKQLEEQEQFESDAAEKAAYYKNYVEFKSEGLAFFVNRDFTVQFEDLMIANGIEFYIYDYQSESMFEDFSDYNNYPNDQKYYIRRADFDQVNNLSKELY